MIKILTHKKRKRREDKHKNYQKNEATKGIGNVLSDAKQGHASLPIYPSVKELVVVVSPVSILTRVNTLSSPSIQYLQLD